MSRIRTRIETLAKYKKFTPSMQAWLERDIKREILTLDPQSQTILLMMLEVTNEKTERSGS